MLNYRARYRIIEEGSANKTRLVIVLSRRDIMRHVLSWNLSCYHGRYALQPSGLSVIFSVTAAIAITAITLSTITHRHP